MTLNQMQIIGNLGGDPEMRYTPEGNAVTTFSVAVHNNYKRRDGSQVDENRLVPHISLGQPGRCVQHLLGEG